MDKYKNAHIFLNTWAKGPGVWTKAGFWIFLNEYLNTEQKSTIHAHSWSFNNPDILPALFIVLVSWERHVVT